MQNSTDESVVSVKVGEAPKPGDIIRLKQTSARDLLNKLVKPLLFRLDSKALDYAGDDVYHHQIVAHDSYITLVPGATAMVIHFFDKPQYVKYVAPAESGLQVTTTTKKFIKAVYKKPQKNTIPLELKGYIAYVLYGDSLWSTDVFSTLEEFLSSYEVIDC